MGVSKSRFSLIFSSIVGLSLLSGLPVAGSASASIGRASAPAWTINLVLSDPSGYAEFDSLAVASQSDAWAGGEIAQMPHVEHWNGTSWVDMTPQGSAFRTLGTRVDAIGTSGPSNTWALVSSSTNAYAMRWTGSSWVKYSFHRYLQVTGIGVFSASNVWAFGVNSSIPFSRHFDGRRWRPVPVPALPFVTSATSPKAIWAAGPTLKSVYSGPLRDVLMHRIAGSWRTVKFPTLGMSRADVFRPAAMLVAGGRDIWITGQIQPFTGPGPIHNELLHWTKGAWHSYRFPFAVGGIASDGSGGLWIARILNDPDPGGFVHFVNGTWQFVAAPLPQSSDPNQTVGISSLAQIPGTKSLWAIGTLATYGFDAMIYRYS